MKPRKIPTGVNARRKFQLRYPRAVDKLHGLTQVDDLFEGTESEPDEGLDRTSKPK